MLLTNPGRSYEGGDRTPKFKEYIFPTFYKKCINGVVRIDSTIIFHLSKLLKLAFFILCDVIFLMRLWGKFEI